MDGVRATDGLRRLPRTGRNASPCPLDQILDRAGHVLDRHVGIDAMLIEEVDASVLAASACVRHLLDVVGPAVQAVARAVRVDSEPNLVAITLGHAQAQALRRPVLRW